MHRLLQDDREPLIDIRNATVRREETTVFSGFSLRIDAGESTALLGPNGAGKTTLLRLLTRELYPVVLPDSHVRILGRELFNIWELRREIGIVSHELQHTFLRALPGREVVLSGFCASVGLQGVPHTVTEEEERAASETARRLGIEHLLDVRFDRMSTGQQRRTLLARSLVHEPMALILDEPTTGLDMQIAHRYLGMLRDLIRTGTTVVLATHYVSEIPPEIERVVLLKEGRVFRDGDKLNVLTPANLSALYDTPVHVVEERGFYVALPASVGD